MNNFKIEIEVNLGKDTLEALNRLGSALVTSAAITTIKPQAPKPETKAEQKAAPAPQPTPEPAPTPAPVADDDDLPLSNAEKAAQEAKTAPNAPSEADMRAAIQATRKRGVPAKTIREYIKSTFGVETSVECPENRRQELIDGLAKLAA